jgi:hypothetical protein
MSARACLSFVLTLPVGLAAAGEKGPASPGQPLSVPEQNALVSDYCSSCHHDGKKSGGLSLETFDAAKLTEHAPVAEKMIRKLRAGLMPPPQAKLKLEKASATLMAEALEARIDRAAAARPTPGWRPFQRLTRAEYARAVHELLALDVDTTPLLPPDTLSAGFDNVADTQAFSPTLMEGYLRAAARVSTLALGDPSASAGETTYKLDRTASQNQHVPGAPLGTRGGISVVHVFPADGEYSFRMMLHSIPTGQLFGSTVKGEQIEVSVNGERVALLEINRRMSEADPNGMNLQTPRLHVKAGPQRVSAAFLERFEAPVDDILAPIEYTLADTQIGSGYGVTALPHLRDFAITGPFKVTGVSDTPSRRRVFSCRPTSADDEKACAAEIVKRLASAAYRGPLTSQELAGLIGFYAKGRKDGDFESGIRLALQAILASPRFLFRLETAPARAGQPYRLADVELASRLSFFLWDAPPDTELLKLASQGGLGSPLAIDKQVKRMLADPRAETLATRFAAQWLRLQDLDKIRPDALLYPGYDATLAAGFRRETELLFDAIVREDRSVLDVLNADYSFVDERVANHYGIPGVAGTAFRRVSLAGTPRRGVLGHGSVLALTSVADRTSPVQRGKWILEVLLGTPPPPPPPDIPPFDATKAVTASGKPLSVRERMEEHRRNPQCTSCHRVMDPLGLALENFDVDGSWRIRDNGVAVDATGTLYDGTPLHGPEDLRQALLARQESVLRTFTEYLMTYALGRRVEYWDMPTIRAIVRDSSRNDQHFSSYVLGIVRSAAFQMSAAPLASAPVAP